MPKFLLAMVLGAAVLLPAATALADEGNWGDRDLSSPSIVVQTEPINLGAIAGDDGLSVGPAHADQEHAGNQ
jgi:hypothetical protein